MNLSKFLDSLDVDEKAELRRMLVDPVTTALVDEERELLRRGDKIGAIKHFRNRTGLGLIESKQLVERFEVRR